MEGHSKSPYFNFYGGQRERVPSPFFSYLFMFFLFERQVQIQVFVLHILSNVSIIDLQKPPLSFLMVSVSILSYLVSTFPKRVLHILNIILCAAVMFVFLIKCIFLVLSIFILCKWHYAYKRLCFLLFSYSAQYFWDPPMFLGEHLIHFFYRVADAVLTPCWLLSPGTRYPLGYLVMLAARSSHLYSSPKPCPWLRWAMLFWGYEIIHPLLITRGSLWPTRVNVSLPLLGQIELWHIVYSRAPHGCGWCDTSPETCICRFLPCPLLLPHFSAGFSWEHSVNKSLHENQHLKLCFQRAPPKIGSALNCASATLCLFT